MLYLTSLLRSEIDSLQFMRWILQLLSVKPFVPPDGYLKWLLEHLSARFDEVLYSSSVTPLSIQTER